MRCRECGSVNITMDFDYGMKYCRACGAIMEQTIYS